VALPTTAAQDQFDEATRETAAACVEHLRPEQLPPCALAFARQVRQLQAIVRDRGKRLEAVEKGGGHHRRQPDRGGIVLLAAG
jgi:hypothetical protein